MIAPAYTVLPLTQATLSAAVQVYCAVWQRDAAEAMTYLGTHADYPHFYGYVAYHHTQPIGMAFGNQTLPGQWWHECVAARIGAIHPMLQEAWLLSELAILPDYRNQQLGSQLHALLVQQVAFFPTLLLTTQVSNIRAQRFYARHGWRTLHHGFAFQPGQRAYCVLYRHNRKSSPS